MERDHATSMEHPRDDMDHQGRDMNGHAGHDMDHGGHDMGGHEGHGGGHDAHAGHSTTMFRDRFWVCLVLTIPVLAYAEGLWELVGLDAPSLPGGSYVSFALGSVIYLYGGMVFLRSAVGELRSRMPGMMTLVALGISVAYVYSAAATFFIPEAEGFYWELATLVDIMLLGHWIEMRSIGRASAALTELAKLLPDTAERVTADGTEEVPVGDLVEGDVVLVRPGARVPADGEVAEGESHTNESMLTGESRAVRKGPGDEVVAGTVNEEGSLRVRVTRTGERTALAGIMRLVEEAQASKSRSQDLADRAAMWLFYVAAGAGVLTFIFWLLGSARGFDFVIERTVTVIVIACPHALGLAVPLVIAISTSLSASSGLLVRNRTALEQARNVDVVVFDKTGTLTRGELGVVGVAGTQAEDELLSLAAGLEHDSEHALARAIVTEARTRGLDVPPVQGFEALKGRGVTGRVGGRELHLGGPRLLASLGVEVPAELRERAQRWSADGSTVVSLVEDGHVLGLVALADVIRPESKRAVERLQAAGVRVAMITGDSEDVAAWVSRELGLDESFAQVLPEDKSARIKELQAQGRRVAMVGDGVNDAPALVQADVGIAIGAGTDVAIESADVVLVRSDPRDVARVIDLSRASYRKMVQNLVWATGYNAFALPLAAGVLAPFGILLPPAVGALLMSVSTVVVAINAQLLRRDGRLRRERPEAREPVPQPTAART
jgi:Cu2+-exporting ATPase